MVMGPVFLIGYASSENHLTLRSRAERGVSKGGNENLVCCPSFETALRASSG
jgi:hypothetical protein